MLKIKIIEKENILILWVKDKLLIDFPCIVIILNYYFFYKSNILLDLKNERVTSGLWNENIRLAFDVRLVIFDIPTDVINTFVASKYTVWQALLNSKESYS